MSELEKQQRDEYQQHRRNLIRIQLIVILFLTLAMIISSVTFVKMNGETYVYYEEEGNVIYKAYLADNEFYTQEYLNGEHAYVTTLIDRMTADFTYDLKMEAKNVDFRYSYRIDAQLEVVDKDSGAALFNPIYELQPEKNATVTGNAFSINESVEIDYNSYNTLAKKFISAYHLDSADCMLIVRLHVDTVGMSESFASDNTGAYVIELRVPLVQTTIKPESSTSVPTSEQKILAKDTSNKAVFKFSQSSSVRSMLPC